MTTDYQALANERASRGAALLDAKVPNWWQRIDTERLDIADCTDCVLGQIFGDYKDDEAYDLAEIDQRPALGFTARLSEDLEACDVTSALTTAWRKLIHERRYAAVKEMLP